MGQVTIVYGVIVEPRDETERLTRLNREVLAALPMTDDWPFLTRAMFRMSEYDAPHGIYRQRPISFSASFKSVEWQWDEWLLKFESLLRTLYWDEAFLHLRPLEATVGFHDYHYQASDTTERFFRSEPPLPVASWEFEGGPREFRF